MRYGTTLNSKDRSERYFKEEFLQEWLHTYYSRLVIHYLFNLFQLFILPVVAGKSQKRLETFIKNSEKKFETFTRDSAVLNSLVTKGIETEKAMTYVNDQVNLYVYLRNDVGNLLLVFWNNHKVIPPAKDLERRDGKYFSVYPNGEFEFIKKTFYLKGKQVITAAVIPIRWNYFFGNEYLKTEFAAVANIENTYDVAKDSANFYVKNGDGKVLFGLKEKKKVQNTKTGWPPLTLRVIAIVFVMIFISMLAAEVAKKEGWVKGFLLLTATVLLLRFLSYQFAFPFNYRSAELFDPIIYGSNSLHPSLGDLLINMILLFWVITFLRFSAGDYFKGVSTISEKTGWIVTGILSVFMVVLAFTAAGIIRSLITDSKISYDVGNFFSLSIYSFISFIILCLIIFIFFYLSHLILLFLYKAAEVPMFVKYIAVTVCGLFYLTLNINNTASVSNLVVLGWLLAYMF
jgi:hypothetical protein